MEEDIAERTKATKRHGSPLEDQQPKEKNRKSARRSSFIRGRISTINGADPKILSSDLLKDIATDLPADEKLKKLTLAALEYTLGKLSMEFPNIDGIQQFTVKVADAGSKKVEELNDKLVFRQAALLNNPPTDPLSLRIQEARNQCKTLENEISQWEQLLDESKLKAENARKATDGEVEPVVSPADYSMNLTTMPAIDYQHVLNKNATTQQEIELMSDELHSGVSCIQAFIQYSNKYLQLKADDIRKESLRGADDLDDPKDLINQFLSV